LQPIEKSSDTFLCLLIILGEIAAAPAP
jgi:hypothetical protein